jgi:ankyrin repeat protein
MKKSLAICFLVFLVFFSLQSGASISLFETVSQEDLTKVRSLLKSGANPNFRNDENRTMLEIAALGSASMIRLLLEHGADPNPAQWAATNSRHTDAVFLLLLAGADPRFKHEGRIAEQRLQTELRFGRAYAGRDNEIRALLQRATALWNLHGAPKNRKLVSERPFALEAMLSELETLWASQDDL